MISNQPTRSIELIFVDSRLSDYQTLIDSLSDFDHEVILIDHQSDGLTQMLDVLQGRSDIDAIHIFSHGSAGQVHLGDTALNSKNLNSYAPLLEQIGRTLTEEGDILLYGCNVAQGAQGVDFIGKLAQATGADIAASDDLTGNAMLGGDWVLEASAGSIEADSFVLSGFASVLPELAQPVGPPGTVTYPSGSNYGSGTINTNSLFFEVLSVPSGVTLTLQGGAQGADRQFTEAAGAFLISDNQRYDFQDLDVGKMILAWTVTVDWTVYTTGTLSFIYSGNTVNYTFAPLSTNTAPTIDASAPIDVTEGTQGQFDLYAAASDAETADNALTYSIVSGPGTINGQYLQYTPAIDASRKGSTYADEATVVRVTDPDGLFAETTVNWNVNYLDNPPTGGVAGITGTSKVGQVLTATDNIADVDDGGAGVAKTYQWQEYNTSTNQWVAITGAPNSASFTPAAGDANKLVRVQITAGSLPQTFTSTDIRLVAPETGPGQIATTGLNAPIIVKNPSGDTEITNNNPVPGTTPITLDGPEGGTTVTTTGNGPVTVANPGGGGGGVTVINTGTGTTTVTGTGSGQTVTPQGPGPIVIETSANPGIIVNNAEPATDLTITNTGPGTVNVTPVGDGGTVKVGGTSTGPITLGNPAGDTTITDNGTSTVTVNNLTTGSTVTSNGTGNGGVTVANPAGDLTLNNTNPNSILTTTGVVGDGTVTTTGTGNTVVSNSAGNVIVNNTGSGTSTVTGTTTGHTVTTQGTGPITVNSVLTTPNGITVNAENNQNITLDNDNTGTITVTGVVTGGSTIHNTGSGNGTTNIHNPTGTGNLTVQNTGTNPLTVTGLDSGATLTNAAGSNGSGGITLASPDGDATIHNIGTNTVTTTGVVNNATINTTGTGATSITDPAGSLTVNNTGSGTVSLGGLNDGATITTNGTQPVTISNPDGDLTIANTGTGLDTVTGLLADKTVTATGSANTSVSDPAGNLTLHNTGSGILTATAVNNGSTVTTTGTTATNISNPDGNVTVNNAGTGVATVTGTTNNSTVTTQGTGPITVNSVLTTGNEIIVAAAANTNVTLDNDSTGTITVTGVTAGSTIKNTGEGSGATNVNNPTGSLNVENTGTNPLTVTGLDTGATLINSSTSTGPVTLDNPDSGTTTVHNQSANSTVTITGAPSAQVVNATGSGATNVNDPTAGLTLHNTGSGTLTATGVNTGQTVITTGTGATAINTPDGNVTVNNTGSGMTTVNGAINGSTVTTQGNGPITVNSVLTTGNTVNVNATSNTNLTVDNDSTGAVNVTGVTTGSTINSTGSGTGTTTINSPTGNLTVNNTGSNIVTVTGFDSNRTLTTPGTGPVTVDNPDGNMFLSNTGSGTVNVSGINVGNTLTVNSGANGPVNVTSPDGNVNVINNSTQLVTVSGVHDGATVNATGSGPQTVNLAGLTAGQSVTIDNDGTGLVNLTNVPYGVTVFFTGTGPATVSSFSGNTGDGPATLENFSTSLVTVANDASGVNGGTVKAAGTGPIKFDTNVAGGETMTVNIADNTNVTFDNDGAGTLTVTGAPNNSTLTSSSSGPMTVINPTGDLTVNNSANGTLNVTGFDNDKTLALNTSGATTVTSPDGNLTVTNSGTGSLNVTGLGADKSLTTNLSAASTVTSPAGNLTLVNNGTGSMTVDGTANDAILTTANSKNISVINPGGNLTVANTGTGTVSVSGLNNGATFAANGSGASNIISPDADASFTVNNTGTGLVSVSGVANGKTITTQGTGQIAISSALGTGEKITVIPIANDNIQITNTGAGQVDVSNNLALDSNDAMNFTLTGNNTTIVNLTGTLDLGSAPLTLNLASGYIPLVGHTITLISNDAGEAITGTFAGRAEGSSIQIGGYLFSISYVGGDGNDVVLTMTGAVPSGGGGGGGSTPPPAPTPILPPQNEWVNLPDKDGDGIPEAVEDFVQGLGDAPQGDGNGDGILDRLQSSVSSVPFRNTDKISQNSTAPQTFVTLAVAGEQGSDASPTANLQNVQQLDAPAGLPEGMVLPLGLISFEATVSAAGAAQTFSLFVDDSILVNGYWKQNLLGTWVNLASAASGGAVVVEGGKTRLDFSITDGGEFDADGVPNGVISDPGAPGWSEIFSVFDETHYLQSKLGQLQLIGQTQYTAASQVKSAIHQAGMTVHEHFLRYSLVEGTDPNALFNTTEYMLAKTRQINSIAQNGKTSWAVDEVEAAFVQAGFFNAWEHFVAYGWKEGVNPSNKFDISSYFAAKHSQTGLSVEQVKVAFDQHNLDPLTHYAAWGLREQGMYITEVQGSERVDSATGLTEMHGINLMGVHQDSL